MKYLGENSTLALIAQIKTWVRSLTNSLQTLISAKPSINDSVSSTTSVYSSNKVNGLLENKADSTALSATNSNLSSLQDEVSGLGLVISRSVGINKIEEGFPLSGAGNYTTDDYTVVLTVHPQTDTTNFEEMCKAKPMISKVEYVDGHTVVTIKCMGDTPSDVFPMMIYVYKTNV